MTAHLRTCWKQYMTQGSGKSSGTWFHLVIEGRYSPEYWLHLQAPAKAKFGDLDSVLRQIWLECCGHLSDFKFPAKRPSFKRGGPRDMFAMMDRLRAVAGMFSDEDDDDALMGVSLKTRLQLGVTFSHQYDFGATTQLSLRVAGEDNSPVIEGAIKVLARNEFPAISCAVCGKPATQVCTDCYYGGNAQFCDPCAADHKCGEEMLLPLLNSPRAGVCGYCGPSVEP